MELILDQKPRNVTIIEGFPGFGLVSTIATEYLITHLDARQIGKITLEEMPPVVAVHSGQIIEPIGVFYSKKYNLVILHALTSVTGFEWKVADKVAELAKLLQAKEIVCIEGVGSNTQSTNAFYLSEKFATKVKKSTKLQELKEGIIMGVSGALMLNKKLPVTCIFAETHSQLPDSRAAAKIIESLDQYLGLKVDIKPLLKKAEEFEEKIKGIMDQSKEAMTTKQKKELSYLG